MELIVCCDVKVSVRGVFSEGPHKYRSTNMCVCVSVLGSMLGPPGHRPLVCSVCVRRAASCERCDVACRDWSATGASAAPTPPVSLQATSWACSRSDTWPEATASRAHWSCRGGSWRRGRRAACPETGTVQSAWCTETRPGSRCLRRVLSMSPSHWSAARGRRKQDSRVCPSESRRYCCREGRHSRQGRAGRGASCRGRQIRLIYLFLSPVRQVQQLAVVCVSTR